MISIAAGFIIFMLFPFIVETADWFKTIVCLNPAIVWYYCSKWFIENDLPVSFAWSEFVTLGIWYIITIFLMLFGIRHLKTQDI